MPNVTSNNQMNDCLLKAMRKLALHVGGGGGAKFEEVVKKEFTAVFKKFTNFQVVDTDQWKGLQANIDPNIVYMVLQPNGKNDWPDILFVWRSFRLSIEAKASNNGGIVWNGGLPQSGGLYFYSRTGGKRAGIRGTTYFIGDDAISTAERDHLLRCHKALNRLAARYNSKMPPNSLWEYYPRAMYNEAALHWNWDKRSKLENSAELFITNLNW